ncbi:MAG TPA: acetylornithine transaminase [Candidatus Binataceae bacterium]|jgi:acetylornithine/N-succinyldiaminopimelate aminotransferase|nr:acetylornithine transaminase [Candidatus Binataceae bacterium]
MTNAEIVELTHKHLVNIYGCLPIAFVEGRGPYLIDADGNRYLDFFCGLAVTSLGHCHPAVVNAIKSQAEKLIHVSNVFHTEPTARLAERLSNLFHGAKVFLANSGAEVNEAAIKLARHWGAENGGRFEIIAMQNSFHGRTMATLSATGQEKYHQGFQPMLPGITLVNFDDIEAVSAAINDKTAAVFVEPIQGEGGVVIPKTANYIERLRKLCDRHKMLLIFDEVQVGIGRTGKLFAHEHFSVRPDVMTLAKALGGGLPIGAMLARPEVAATLTPGTHGTTFGGNPVACAAALAVLDTLEKERVLENATAIGNYLMEELRTIAKTSSRIVEVRGQGMIIGAVLKGEARPVVDACLKERLILNATATNVLRLLPPLNLTLDQAQEGMAIIRRALTA